MICFRWTLGFVVMISLSCANPTSSGSGSPSAAQISSISGTWNLQSAVCGGQAIGLGDMTDSFTVSGNIMSTKNTSVSSDCAVSNSNITLTVNGSYVFSSGGAGASCSKFNCTPSAQNNFCQIASCQIPITMNGIQIALSCPQNFPMFLDGLVSYSVVGSSLVRTVILPDKTCQYTYGH